MVFDIYYIITEKKVGVEQYYRINASVIEKWSKVFKAYIS